MKIFALLSLVIGLLFNGKTTNAATLTIKNTSNCSDTIPIRLEAQDFNTTRSNRQNSSYKIVIDENGTANNNDSTPRRLEAQDFNTTRSNRQNSNYIIINIVNNPSEAGDDIKGIGKNPLYGDSGHSGDNPLFEASNKMSTRGKNTSTGKQQNAIAPAQDYNSSRSNKANGIVTINVYNNSSNTNGDAPSHQEAQDYNSTRSNKANCLTIDIVNNSSNNATWRILREPPTESYNPWEMDDSNEGTVMNPLYEADGNSGDNPMFEASNKMSTGGKNNSTGKQPNAIAPAQDYNSSRSNKANGIVAINVYNNSSNTNGNAPSHQEAQDYNSSRSNKANCLTIDIGGTNGNSEHTGNGWNFNLGYQAPVSGVLKWTASVGYASWKFKYNPSPLIPEKYLVNMHKSIRDQSWGAITINTGPAIQIGSEKLYADIYGKAGVSFIKTPNQFVGSADDLGNVTKETGMAMFSGNMTTLSFQTGLRINYAISRMLDVFVHPYYFSTLGKNISYTEKDVSKAINDAGSFNADVFRGLPFDKKEDRIQSIGLSAGIKIRFLRHELN